MKEKNEAQLAWQIWKLIVNLNDLLWIRYENEFREIDFEEDQEKYFRSTRFINSSKKHQDKENSPP